MGIASGLDAQIGFAKESTYGTRVVPTRFLEFVEEGMELDAERIESKAVRAGGLVERSDRWVANRKGASGDVEFEVANKGFGMLFENLFGAVSIVTPGGGTTARDHDYTLADTVGKSLTMQIGRPDGGGTVNPYDYLGCKIVEGEFSNDVDGLLMFKASFDAQDELDNQSLAAKSYASNVELLSFVGGSVSIGGAAYTAAQKTSVKIARPYKLDRHFIRGSSLKKEPVLNGLAQITGSLDGEFLSKTAYDRFRNGTLAAVELLWEGSIIEAALKFHVKITLPAVRFDGKTPNVKGHDVLEQELPFKALDAGAGAITLQYRTTDTAV
jgi:hypothetical protein